MDAWLHAICEAVKEHGFVIHASGAIRRAGSYLFLARSGGGKSTVATLCDNGRIPVLSDETALVLEAGSAFHLRSLPRQNSALPALIPLGEGTCLRGVMFLERASRLSARKISLLQAVARCLKEGAILGFGEWPPSQRLAVLDRLFRLFRTVPAYVLHFRKDNSFWKVIDELEEREKAEPTKP